MADYDTCTFYNYINLFTRHLITDGIHHHNIMRELGVVASAAFLILSIK